jgi:putative ABC transport system permease protein
MLRSFLATLGVIIGVAAVVAAVSILKGAEKEIVGTINSFGSNVLVLFPGAAHRGGRQLGAVETLSIDDARAVAQQCPAVIRTTPEVLGLAQVKFFSKNKRSTVLGTTPEYADIRNYNVQYGRFITTSDLHAVVLGYKVAKDLFGRGSAALNATVKINGKPFNVIGVMEKKGTIGFTRVDDQVIIPVDTAMKRLFGLRSVQSISIQIKNTQEIDDARTQIKHLLQKRHKITPGMKSDFVIFSPEQLVSDLKEVTDILSIVFYSIAGISLVVGGIGIMNIMLVSVTERTREIGVRMAVGARRWDILSQFLAESGLISLVGGAAGVLVGFGFSRVIRDVSRELVKPHVPHSAIVTALTVAFVIGVISGLYPAYKASRLDPVEALRYE